MSVIKRSMAMLLTIGCLCAAALAGPFDDGKAAYDRGDYTTAFKLLNKLAGQGNAEAQYLVGTMYGTGVGVPQNHHMEAKFYRSAAEQGHAKAQFILGFMRYEGIGVAKSRVLAYMWWSLAAAQGIQDAAVQRDQVAKLLSPEQIAEAQRLATHWKPKGQ